MARDKARDDKYFSCDQEHEINYVSGLYVQKETVKAFLKRKCADNTIRYSTHYEVYKLIQVQLGFPIPD